MDSIEFVTFHYSLGPGQESHPNETLRHKEYLSIISMMLKSAQLFHPHMQGVVITSSDTSLQGVHFPVTRYNAEVDPLQLMLSRTKAQHQYVRESSFESPIVFLDSDMLINESFAPIFEKNFDVAVTCRTHSSVPINGGLMILNNRRPERVRKFFDLFTGVFEKQFADQAKWYGDQSALGELLKLQQFADAYPEFMEIDGCRVLLLPCDTYNFSPDNSVSSIREPLADKFVIHFKGQRKHLMNLYWRAYLVAGNRSNFWQNIFRYRGRRELQRLLQVEKELAERTC